MLNILSDLYERLEHELKPYEELQRNIDWTKRDDSFTITKFADLLLKLNNDAQQSASQSSEIAVFLLKILAHQFEINSWNFKYLSYVLFNPVVQKVMFSVNSFPLLVLQSPIFLKCLTSMPFRLDDDSIQRENIIETQEIIFLAFIQEVSHKEHGGHLLDYFGWDILKDLEKDPQRYAGYIGLSNLNIEVDDSGRKIIRADPRDGAIKCSDMKMREFITILQKKLDEKQKNVKEHAEKLREIHKKKKLLKSGGEKDVDDFDIEDDEEMFSVCDEVEKMLTDSRGILGSNEGLEEHIANKALFKLNNYQKFILIAPKNLFNKHSIKTKLIQKNFKYSQKTAEGIETIYGPQMAQLYYNPKAFQYIFQRRALINKLNDDDEVWAVIESNKRIIGDKNIPPYTNILNDDIASLKIAIFRGDNKAAKEIYFRIIPPYK